MTPRPERAVAARVLYDTGRFTYEEIADILGASKSSVHRWCELQPSTFSQSAVEDLEELLATQDLDDYGKFRAGIARQLARKLDSAAGSSKAEDAKAVPDIAKELRAVVAEIMDVSSDDKEWLAGLLAPVGDAENART